MNTLGGTLGCSSNVLSPKSLRIAFVAVRYKKNTKKREQDPFLYKYDRWGKVKKLEQPGGRKKIPFDKRFRINPKDVAPTKFGGSIELCRTIGKDKSRFPHPPGYYDKCGRFQLVKEMIPEFVVPDLTDFKLKPYVAYNVSEINQSTFTAEELFYSTYAKAIGDTYIKGKIKNLEKFQKKFEEDESKQEKLESKISRLALQS